MFYRLFRPLLFHFDAESVHNFVMSVVRFVMGLAVVRSIVRWWGRYRDPVLEQTLWGTRFENPVGLAAGFDKNARYFNELGALGFGFVEIGTVTGQAQEGNPRPRMFRLRDDAALLNRMGFNNHGSEAVSERLATTKIEPILGVNIGKTKVVPLEEASSDYELSFRRLFDYARYFVVNVSSPNTPGLRELQNKEPLTELLTHLQELNQEMAERRSVTRRPILLKISPDITEGQLDDIIEVVEECRLDGIIATNTTVEREDLSTPGQESLGSGGVSGKPLQQRALQLIEETYRRSNGEIPIIGVGGIFTGEDALAAMRAGASLVQVWTGFVYEGPGMVRRINRHLARACQRNGWYNISEAVGADVEAP